MPIDQMDRASSSTGRPPRPANAEMLGMVVKDSRRGRGSEPRGGKSSLKVGDCSPESGKRNSLDGRPLEAPTDELKMALVSAFCRLTRTDGEAPDSRSGRTKRVPSGSTAWLPLGARLRLRLREGLLDGALPSLPPGKALRTVSRSVAPLGPAPEPPGPLLRPPSVGVSKPETYSSP